MNKEDYTFMSELKYNTKETLLHIYFDISLILLLINIPIGYINKYCYDKTIFPNFSTWMLFLVINMLMCMFCCKKGIK